MLGFLIKQNKKEGTGLVQNPGLYGWLFFEVLAWCICVMLYFETPKWTVASLCAGILIWMTLLIGGIYIQPMLIIGLAFFSSLILMRYIGGWLFFRK